MVQTPELELLSELEAEFEGETGRRKKGLLERLGAGRGARIGALMRILGLLKGLPDDALPPPPPPPAYVAPRKPKAGQGEFELLELAPELEQVMEALSEAATQTESELEASAFIGALIPLASRFPQANSSLAHSAAGMLRGLTGTTRVLHRDPEVRSLIRSLPAIVRQTARTLDNQLSQGKSAPQRVARRVLAQQLHREFTQESELEFDLFEIERMAGDSMTKQQKRQIMAAIDASLAATEHTSGKRGSTKGKHQSGMARRRKDKWNRAVRVFQSQGFAAALADAQR